MPNDYFQFKQFIVHHDRCAMKIGTDGVLLGAWAPVGQVRSILDVGTGSGLIALQLAQRCPGAQITAIELDSEAAGQARSNADSSPWGKRIDVVCADFTRYNPTRRFDLIVSNPPFFIRSLHNPDAARCMARHTDTLSPEALVRQAASLLSPTGNFSLIVPADTARLIEENGWYQGLSPRHITRVFTKPGKPCKRILMTLSATASTPCLTDELCIHTAGGTYSEEYIRLTSPFYLDK